MGDVISKCHVNAIINDGHVYGFGYKLFDGTNNVKFVEAR